MAKNNPSSDRAIVPEKSPLSPVDYIIRDQRRKWTCGERVFLENYLRKNPKVVFSAQQLLDLIYHEILLREGAGEPPEFEEYAQRFPALRDELRLHFDIHSVLSDIDGPNEPTQGFDPAGPSAGSNPPTAIDPAAESRYVPAEEIARGGMGTVLRARDERLGRVIAVKYLLDQADQDKRARFIAEARITGRLQHPNIVPVHDLGVDARGQVFFAMKMVNGRSLADILEALRTNPGNAREWTLPRLLAGFVDVCNALAYAHARGVIHRDVKPGNIMLGEFGAVYLMDWGLAKVLPGFPDEGDSPAADGTAVVPAPSPPRMPDPDLTREGSVMGTLVYMSPEQASGLVGAVDARTDVYSLGAILYETLTLRPHLDKTNDDMAMIRRVVDSRVDPPEERTPDRARAGLIPPELSAVAMKALARDPADRYPSVEALKRDIERYLDGRSVSAKDYTVRELVWKMVKRNKAVTVVTTVSLLLLAAIVISGLLLLNTGRIEAERAIRRMERAELARQEEAVKAMPAYLRAARLAASQRQFADALIQLDTAAQCNPQSHEPYFLKGMLLAAMLEFPEAAEAFDLCLPGYPPEDDRVQRLVHLCRIAAPDKPKVIQAIADILRTMDGYPMDVTLYSQIDRFVKSQEERLDLYRKRVDAAWPGAWRGVTLTDTKQFVLDLQDRKDVHDLASIAGMGLTRLSLRNCEVLHDLSPLAGMPLTSLDLDGCRSVHDLSPILDSKLAVLDLSGCVAVPDLKVIRRLPLKSLAVRGCPQVADLADFRELKLRSLDISRCANVRDFGPIRDMPLVQLTAADCRQLKDLSPLRGLTLKALDVSFCEDIRDLSPLAGMPLTRLSVRGCAHLVDVSPLGTLPNLVSLNLSQCRVADLSPLRGRPLSTLNLDDCPIADLDPLRGMPLKNLTLHGCDCIKDLSPLAGLPLRQLFLPSNRITADQARSLHSIETLETIRLDFTDNGQMTAADFWRRYDAGEFRKP